MTLDVDPRAWNLLTGLALVTGCSGRTISVDGDSTDSINDGETTLNPDGPDTGPETGPDTGPPPECYTDADCGDYFYYCENGICEYVPHHDGHIPYYECYSDYECGLLSLCEFNYCQGVDSPPQCDFVLPAGPTLEIPDQALALAFADVDDDGAQELVVASQTQLHMYENGSLGPISSARGIESNTVDAMVGGQFDEDPGIDVIVLHDDEFDLHRSDGLGGLSAAIPTPSPYSSTMGIQAGDFDTVPPTDLLVWSTTAAGVLYGSGELAELLAGGITSGSARDYGLPGNGFTLLTSDALLFLDIGGFNFGSAILNSESAHIQTSLDALGEPFEVGSSAVNNWTLIEVFDRLSSGQTAQWGLLGTATRMRAGDLDGLDDTDELALIVDDGVWVHVGGECLLPVPLDTGAVELAFGDHDGDGDDELAVLTSANTISIVDVE